MIHAMAPRKVMLSTIFSVITAFSASSIYAEDVPPQAGAKAPQFELKSLVDGKPVSLNDQLKKGPVVLVVLRGFPGYQCPICSRQVGGLIQEAQAISKSGASVLMVYPGLAKGLEDRAKEFFSRHQLPDNFTVVTDPDYGFTNKYHLRWDAPRETAYPSTFVIGEDGKIVHVHISKSHGNRTKTADIIAALNKLPS